MKHISVILAALTLTGCASTTTHITAQGDVYCISTVDKPVSVIPSFKADGNTVPVMP